MIKLLVNIIIVFLKKILKKRKNKQNKSIILMNCKDFDVSLFTVKLKGAGCVSGAGEGKYGIREMEFLPVFCAH